MSSNLLLPISMLACLLGGTINKIYSSRWNEHGAFRYVFTLTTGLVSAIILFLWGGIEHISVFTLALGVTFGVVTALQSIFLLQALQLGSYAYTVVFTSLSMLIPALSGCIFWNEKLGILQIIGMLLIVICLILSVDRSEGNKKITLKWLFACGIAFLCGGLIGVLQKIHQTSPYQDELNAFLVIAFAFSCIFSAVACLISINRDGKIRLLRNEKILIMTLLIIAGACIAVNNKLNLYLSGVMNSAIFFPLVNGGHLVLTALVAVVFFHEKLTARQWVGLVSGFVAVLMLCI